MRSRRAAALGVVLVLATACGAAAPSPAASTSSPTAISDRSLAPSPAVTVSASASASVRVSTAPRQRRAAPMIVIDPGHSGKSIRSRDQRTGLLDVDYPNYPELYEMFDVSSCVAAGLRRDGYRVTMTKKSARSSVSLAARARLADRVKAALAISVHDDHSQTASFQATYSQRGVKRGGRYPVMYRGRGAHRTVFKLPSVARASEKAAKIIAAARTTAQKRKVTVRQNSFNGRAPLEPGNLALVQLLTSRPWVYQELGARTRGSTTRAISIGTELGYAKGLLIGVERAVPLNGRVVSQPSAGARGLRSCLVARVKQDRPKRYLPDGWGR